ncbi:MAG: hypothetical protein ACXW3P_05940, partial [Rhodospirillales bacterium]
AGMPEVRSISAKEQPPNDIDHVVIRRTPSGKFRADGSVRGKEGATYYVPPPFDSLERAIAEACDWASQNDVPVVYVRDG